jgi:thiamine-phosphate pyrophosphorylase
MSDVSTATVKAGSVPCGLYLVLPSDWLRPDFFKDLQNVFRAINASPYEKNSHIIELPFKEDGYGLEQLELLKAIVQNTKSQGVNFIVSKDIELAKQCGADGVIVNDVAAVEQAREILGEDSIIGLRCGTSRILADKAIEAGVDYVGFADSAKNYVDPGIVQWWHYKTSNPCYVEGNFTNDDCAFYVSAGTDFIDASAYVWSHPEGVMKGVVNMTYAIDLALDQQTKGTIQ